MFLYKYNGVIWAEPKLYDGNASGNGLRELTDEEERKLPWEFFFNHCEFNMNPSNRDVERQLSVTYIDHDAESFLIQDCCKGLIMSFYSHDQDTSSI